jgi:hypothetical protein
VLDKVCSPGRDQLPFLVRVRDLHSQDRAGATRHDQGPPAAAMCAVNRDLLAHRRRQRQPAASITGPPTPVAAVASSATDWSAATCCP